MTGVGLTYFAGGEDVDFLPFVGSVAMFNNNSLCRAAWCRAAVAVQPAAVADPPINRFLTQTFGPVPSCWVHGQFAWGATGGAATLNAVMLRLIDQHGTARLMVRGAGSGAVKISTRNAAGVFTDLVSSAANVLPVGGLSPAAVDMEVIYTGSVSMTRSDISFASGTPASISTSSGNFVTAGFVKGSRITVTGSASNNGTYQVGSASTGTLDLIAGDALTNESDSENITISANGLVNLYLGTSLVATYAGDITTDNVTAGGTSVLSQADFSSISTSVPMYWSEILVSDSITINAGVFLMAPVAAGGTQAWAGAVADIDKYAINDTTFISDDNAGDLSEWTAPTTLPTGAWIVQSVVQSARVAKGVSGPAHFDWVLRIGYPSGTDYTAGTSNAPTTLFSNFGNYVWANSPATSSAWAVTEIGAGFNIGLKSLA